MRFLKNPRESKGINMINELDIEDAYPLSPMQEGMLFHSMVDKKPTVYLEQFDIPIHRELDKGLIEDSFNKLIEKYGIFRTNFIYEKVKKPIQVVLKRKKINICFKDISHLETADKIDFMAHLRNEDREKGFHLGRDPLIRISLIKISKESYRLVWTFHHILMDGWCLGIVLNELFTVYQALEQGKPIRREKEYPYSNYIKWLARQDKAKGLQFWKEYLEGYNKKASLPGSGKISPGYKLKEYCFLIDEKTSTHLMETAKANQVTLSTVFQVLWGVLLQKYNNTNDVVFGAVVSGRPPEVEGIEKMVGLFVNAIPVRIKVEAKKEERFSQMLQKRQREAILSKPFEYIPLPDIQAQSLLKGDLIDNLIAFENYPIQTQITEMTGIGVKGVPIDNIKIFEQSNYDFGISVGMGKKLLMRMNFNSLAKEPAFVKRLGYQFMEVVGQVIKNDDIPLQDIKISGRLLPAESDQIREYQRDFEF